MTNDRTSNQRAEHPAQRADAQRNNASATSIDRVKRQRIGRRLGAEPYYMIVAQEKQRLLLDSRPELNLPVARRFLQVSAVLFVLMLLIVAWGVAMIPRVGVAPALLLLLPLLIVGIPAMGCFTVGRVLQRVRHRIEVDNAQGAVIYRQRIEHSPKPPISQTLRFDQITGLRLATRMIKPFPAQFRRKRPLSVLELSTVDGHSWLVDSATDRAALLPTAQALAQATGLPLAETA